MFCSSAITLIQKVASGNMTACELHQKVQFCDAVLDVIPTPL